MTGAARTLSFSTMLSAVLLLGGCHKSPAPTPPGSGTAGTSETGAPVPGVLNSDGTYTNPNGSVTVPANQAGQAPAPQGAPVRNADGSITNPDGSVTYPAGSSVAQREASAANSAAMASAPGAPPAPVSITAPAGTAVVVRITNSLAASRNEVGDHFSGVLERPILEHGETVFAAGTPVSGEVVASKGKGRFKGAGDLGIVLTAIGRDHVSTSEYEKVAKGRGKRTAGFIGGGGGLGAIIGGIAGGGKGALIGGLAGAGAGTAAGAYTGSRDVVIPSESVVTFRLRASLTR